MHWSDSAGAIPRAVIARLALGLLLVAAGCAAPRPTMSHAPRPAKSSAPGLEAQTEVQERLKEIFDAATKKDFARLDSYHLYGPNFTKFSTSEPERQDAATAREAEHTELAAVSGMKVRVENLKVDIFNDVAVATFILHYSFVAGTETIERGAKGTMVLVLDQGGWKIAHEHFSARD